MSYILESSASTSRRRRRRRAFVTLVVVALMLFFAFWYAYSYYQTAANPTAVPSPTCTTAVTAAPAPKPREVTLNVYNATDRDGLAARTAAEVRRRGFAVATVANDPLGKSVPGPAEVRYGRSGASRARLVLALVKGARPVRDARTDASVDLVLGEAFTALNRPAPARKPAATPPPASRATAATPTTTTRPVPASPSPRAPVPAC